MANPTKKDTEIVIVGAGPVGLIIALMIAQAGIKCILLETLGEIIQSPRAIAYGPAAVVELERAGVAQECREIGMEPSDYEFTLRWITLNNKLVAELPSRLMEGYRPVLCGQHQVAGVILKHLQRFDNAKILWNHKVVGIEQDEGVTAICETECGEVRITGDYLIGADGARSTVRKLLGCTFDGFTYDKMVVATNVFYPFRENGFADSQFIIHPEHFAMVQPIWFELILGWKDITRWYVSCILW
jgi:2-polyprenyl-6-methoxyphenol hydroxylase-like FAD-dependent oxidoreductase